MSNHKKTKVTLKIANVIIRLNSQFPVYSMPVEESEMLYGIRFQDFFYTGRQAPQVVFEVKVVSSLPVVSAGEEVFAAYEERTGEKNWAFYRQGKDFWYECLLPDRMQLVHIHRSFTKGTIYLLTKGEQDFYGMRQCLFFRKHKGFVWLVANIAHNFLQVFLIHYLALRKQGLFAHAIGVNDAQHGGMLFTGKSGAGKTTLARIWNSYSRALVINDDRIFLERNRNEFFMHTLPWRGEFIDRKKSVKKTTKLKRIFLIYHAPKNEQRLLSPRKAFSLIYPSLFSPMWDRAALEQMAELCQDLVTHVPCYHLGFVNDKKIIPYVRGIH